MVLTLESYCEDSLSLHLKCLMLCLAHRWSLLMIVDPPFLMSLGFNLKTPIPKLHLAPHAPLPTLRWPGLFPRNQTG